MNLMTDTMPLERDSTVKMMKVFLHRDLTRQPYVTREGEVEEEAAMSSDLRHPTSLERGSPWWHGKDIT